VRLITRGG
jgi:bifunctional non-homologous end joining protein LigD